MLERFGGEMCIGSQISALWQKPGSAAEGLSAAEHGWGGSLSAVEACPRKETFVSVWQFRPPKVLPNMHEFRLCLGVSAAEGAAEPA